MSASGMPQTRVTIQRQLFMQIHGASTAQIESCRTIVTEAGLDYEGSMIIDEQLILAANIVEFKQVDVPDFSDGRRLTTYTIKGPGGSGVVRRNGAAAQLTDVGDLVIIVSYADFHENGISDHQPGWMTCPSRQVANT